jgi:hypothetical protein
MSEQIQDQACKALLLYLNNPFRSNWQSSVRCFLIGQPRRMSNGLRVIILFSEAKTSVDTSVDTFCNGAAKVQRSQQLSRLKIASAEK